MVLAHGIGGAKDLPIPALYAILGAGVALVASFVVLAVAWRSPRYDASRHGRPAPAVLASLADSTAVAVLLRGVGLLVAAYVVWAAVAGPDLATNPTFGVVYVLLWVGVVPASLLFGPAYRAVNPLRTLHLGLVRLTGGSAGRGLVRLPAWVGLWPAALGLLAFVWLELVYPGSTYLTPVRLWFTVYAAVVLVGALVFGDDWIAAADPFEAYSTLVGRLSVLGRTGVDGDGALVVRSPLANLDGVPPRPGLVAVVAVLFGSTGFDSFKDSSRWLRFTQSVSGSTTWLDFVALLGFSGLVGVSFVAAVRAADRVAGADAGGDAGTGGSGGTARLPALFAHSVVPIVVGYVVAHYLTYFVEVGQQTLVQLSDPLGNGSDLLGTADWQVSYWLSEQPSLLAVVKVLAVVVGHVLGAVSAHDRAVRLLPPGRRVVGQLPLLAVMIVFTIGGLALLFSA